MDSLASYKLHYEDLNPNTRKGGKDNKMSKKQVTTEAPAKTYNKSRGEHFKDIVIAILITAIVAFVGGMQFQNKQQDAIDTAVNAVSPSASAEPVKK